MVCPFCHKNIINNSPYCLECGQTLLQDGNISEKAMKSFWDTFRHGEQVDYPQYQSIIEKFLHHEHKKRRIRFVALISFFIVVLCFSVWIIPESINHGMFGQASKIQIDTSFNSDNVEAANESLESVTLEEYPVSEEKIYDSEESEIHWYSYIVDDCTWTEAWNLSVHDGGYLVHINSQEEYQHIIDNIMELGYEHIQFRIGGCRAKNETDYYWVNKENELYGNCLNSNSYWARNEWMNGEPSYQDGNIEEEFLEIFYYKRENRWVWNDVPNDITEFAPEFRGKLGYIVEYDYPIANNAIAPITMDHVVKVNASSELEEYNMIHSATRLVDGSLEKAWVEGVYGQGIGESVDIIFDDEYIVSGFTIYAGYQKSRELYQKNSRPASIRIAFEDGMYSSYELGDIFGRQDIMLESPKKTNHVTFFIESVYAGNKYEDTVISELSLF